MSTLTLISSISFMISPLYSKPPFDRSQSYIAHNDPHKFLNTFNIMSNIKIHEI